MSPHAGSHADDASEALGEVRLASESALGADVAWRFARRSDHEFGAFNSHARIFQCDHNNLLQVRRRRAPRFVVRRLRFFLCTVELGRC
jgi:hypothetical protein